MEINVKTSIGNPDYHALKFVRAVLTPIGDKYAVSTGRTIESENWNMQCVEIDKTYSIAIWKVTVKDELAPLILMGLMQWASVDFTDIV